MGWEFRAYALFTEAHRLAVFTCLSATSSCYSKFSFLWPCKLHTSLFVWYYFLQYFFYDLGRFWCYLLSRIKFPECKRRKIYSVSKGKVVNAAGNARKPSCAIQRLWAKHQLLSESRDKKSIRSHTGGHSLMLSEKQSQQISYVQQLLVGLLVTVKTMVYYSNKLINGCFF